MQYGEIIITRRDSVSGNETVTVERPTTNYNKVLLTLGDSVLVSVIKNGVNLMEMGYVVTEAVPADKQLRVTETISVMELPSAYPIITSLERFELEDVVVYKNGVSSAIERPRNIIKNIGPFAIGDTLVISLKHNGQEQFLFEHTIVTAAEVGKKVALRLRVDFYESL